MQFVNPIWLWGITGLLIPIGIHLLSRRQGKTIKIGSIRHLQETNSKQFKSIHLNELFLLILRCVLITILVLFLSGLNLKSIQKSREWLIVENGLEHDPQFSVLIDSLKKSGFEIKRLTSGLPDLSDRPSVTKNNNYWNLLREIENEPLDQAVVLSYNYAEGFKGERASLPENVKWISKTPAPNEFILNATRVSNDSLIVRTGHSSADKTSFYTRGTNTSTDRTDFKFSPGDSVPIETSKTISIQVVHDPSFGYDRKIMVAALHALDDQSPHMFNVETVPLGKFSSTKKTDWVIWLSDKPWKGTDINCIYFREKDTNLLFEMTTGSSWTLTERLNEQIALDQNLTVQLGLILGSENKYDEIARHNDKRSLADKLIWSHRSSTPQKLSTVTQNASSEKYLMLAMTLTLFFERWMALKKNQ